MLKIEGTSGFPRDIVPAARGDDHKDQTLEEMMEQFEKRMGELRRVIEAGGNYPPNKRPGFNRAGDTEEDTSHYHNNNNTANSGEEKDAGQAQDRRRTVEHGSGESYPNPNSEQD